MKKTVALLTSSVIIIICLILLNNNLSGQIHKKYHDKMGDIIDYRKFQGIAMQKEAAKRPDGLFIFGSSEVGSTQSKDPFHPSNFFANKDRGFQVVLVGRAYCQSLIHTLNIGAVGDYLKGKKVVFIVSPQWFDKKGLTPLHLKVNFSEEQFYGFMFNNKISMDLKRQVAERILKILKKSDDMNEVKEFCTLIVNGSPYYEARLIAETPYFKARSFMLQLKDKVQTINIIDRANKALLAKEYDHNFPVNWNKDLSLFNNIPINNPFDFDNYLYNEVYSKEIKLMKEYTHPADINTSPEVTDFKLLLDTFKEIGVKPLIISLPMNGEWYDYCGINREQRMLYYEKVKEIVKSYNFELMDMSGIEYEKHAFKDSGHLEWKGLVYVDEGIDKYYHGNSK